MKINRSIGSLLNTPKQITNILIGLVLLAGTVMPALLITTQHTDATELDHVVINEIMADPSSGLEWIELYNPTASTVVMSNWRIRQNSSGNFSGVFDPGTTIAPHGFLIREKTTTTALTNSGATLYLETSANASDVDTLTYPDLPVDNSYARTYDANDDTPEIRTGAAITKNASNGTAPISSTVNTEEFVANNGTYRGISVGFNVQNFGTVSAVVVDMERADGSHVIKNANQGVLDLASNKTSPTQLTAPFVIQNGSFTEAGDTFYWQPAPATWSSSTRPVSVTISVTDQNGTKSATNNVFNDGAPSWPTYESLLPVTPPAAHTQTTQNVLQSDFANSMSTWTYHDDNTSVANPNATANHKIVANSPYVVGNNGAVQLDATASGQRWNLASLQYSGTKLSDIAAIGFDLKTDSPGKAYINLDVDFNHTGLSGYQGRLVYVPSGVTANTWGSHEAVASNGQWAWSKMITATESAWPDGETAPTRSWSDIVAAFPNARITALDDAAFGSLYLRTDGVSQTQYDNVYLATATQNVKYNFELPDSYVYSPGDSNFVYPEWYSRAGSSADDAAFVRVPKEAEEVQFSFDGDTDFNNIPGYEHIQPGQWPNSSGEKRFKVKPALPNGRYDVSARYKVAGNWYNVTGSAVAFAIDVPTASYVLPTTNAIYRPSDNPIRLRVEDQFDQFLKMKVNVNGSDFWVNRADCDLRESGNYLLCDVSSSASWTPLPEGTYTATTTTYTKANNRADNLVSPSFKIDATNPTLSNFVVTSPQAVYGASIDVSADATDANGIKNVRFYLTAPRVDGVCDGNGTVLFSTLGSLLSGSTYGATFDTAGLNGNYCLNAQAEDMATHHSQISKIKVDLDNAAPLWSADPVHLLPTDGSSKVLGDSILMQWSDATDSNGVKYYYEVSSVSGDVTGSDGHFVNPFYLPFGPFSVSEMDATGTALGNYFWHVKACDDLGNCTPWTNPWTGSVVEAEDQPSTNQNTGSNDSGDNQNAGRNGAAGAVITPAGQVLGATIVAPGNNAGGAGAGDNNGADKTEGKVEGANTTKEFASSPNTLGESTTNKGCSKIFGLCWYYWPPIVIGVITIIYFGYRSRENEA